MPERKEMLVEVPPGSVVLTVDELSAHVLERALIQLRDCEGLTSREQARTTDLLDTMRRMQP